MKKILMLAPLPLLLLTACGNNSGNEGAAVQAQAMVTAEKSKCTQGPFKNKHELAKLLTERVYGKPKQVVLDVLGKPDSVHDSHGGKQQWYYTSFCSEPDEITGKEIVMELAVYIKSDGVVDVEREPLTMINTAERF